MAQGVYIYKSSAAPPTTLHPSACPPQDPFGHRILDGELKRTSAICRDRLASPVTFLKRHGRLDTLLVNGNLTLYLLFDLSTTLGSVILAICNNLFFY